MELFERAAYYGLNSVLAVYLTVGVAAGGLAFSEQSVGFLQGIVYAATYVLPILGGALAMLYDKLGKEVLPAWSRILTALPDARLRMASKHLGNAAVTAQFVEKLRQHGIDPARGEMSGPSPTRETYLARYAEVDIMLDTFPYPGVTTTCEALWMGVPTITLAGETLLARQGAGVLTAAGLKNWIAASIDDYVEKAVALAGDPSGLAKLRAGLREQTGASPIFDAPRFARNFEKALWQMWQTRNQMHPRAKI